jgi:hypothetical protein
LENATPDHFSPSPGRKFWNEIEAPASTRYVSLQVRFKDGTVSAVQTDTVPPERLAGRRAMRGVKAMHVRA